MKRCALLLALAFLIPSPAYAPADSNASEKSNEAANAPQAEDEYLATVAAREQKLVALLNSAQELRQAQELLRTAQLLNQAGQLQLDLYRPQEALATFKDSLALTNHVNDPATRVDALNGVAAAYLNLSNLAETEKSLKQAITISEQNNYPAGRAEALLLLSDWQNHSDHVLALGTARNALVLWQSLGKTRGIVRSHLSIGTYQLAQSSLDEAIQSNEVALNLAREHHLVDLEAEALISLGFIEYRKGAWQNVTRFLSDAEDLIDVEAEPVKMTQITSGIAEAYIESGLPEDGLIKYKQAVEYVRKTQTPRDIIVINWGVAKAQYLLGNYSEALTILQQALGEAQMLKDRVVMAMCHDSLGRTYKALNNSASALSHFETALSLYTQANNPMEAARTVALIGQVYELSGRLDEARKFYQKALKRFDAVADSVNQSVTLFALGKLEMKSGNYDKAESLLWRSIEVTENMRRLSRSRDLTAAFSATVSDRYEKYIDCLMRNDRGPMPELRNVRAFETSESARARSLAQLLRESDTNLLASVDPKLSEQERSLRQLLRVKEDERIGLLNTNYKKDEMKKLEADLARLSAEYKNLSEAMSARYPAYKQLTQPRSWDLKRIQEEVIKDNDTMLLEFSLGADRSYVWAVTSSSITGKEIPKRDTIEKAVQALHALLSEPAKPDNKEQLDHAAQELAQMVLSPVSSQLNKKRIILVADGALNYIPFQMLPATWANSEPLLSQYEINNAPSATILGELREQARHRTVRPKTLVAFGNPVFAWTVKENESNANVASASLETRDVEPLRSALRHTERNKETFDPSVIERLFYSGREIASLVDVASEAQSFVATDYAATRDQLLAIDLTQYAILHIATHGFLDPEHPEGSGLLLSTIDPSGKPLNGFVRLQDVYSLQAPLDLVVLSACNTGLGKDVRGEGLVGLTRGFMYAGATSVVASLWQVQDEATAELMKQFYIEMLENGLTPGDALRAAQNTIRKNPKWSSPHYWAGFILQGEYLNVVKSARRGPNYAVLSEIGILLVLLTVAGYLYWRPGRKAIRHRRSSRH